MLTYFLKGWFRFKFTNSILEVGVVSLLIYERCIKHLWRCIYTHYFTLCIVIIYIYVHAHTRSCKQKMQHLDLQSFAQKHAVFKTPGVVTLAVCCTRTWVCARWTVSKRWCAVAMLPRPGHPGPPGPPGSSRVGYLMGSHDMPRRALESVGRSPASPGTMCGKTVTSYFNDLQCIIHL